MTQLDDILAHHPDADTCPNSKAWRRELLIELRRTRIIRRGVQLRLRPNQTGRPA